MNRALTRLTIKNNLLMMANKFLSLSIEAGIKKQVSREKVLIDYTEALQQANAFIEKIDKEYDECISQNLNLTRVVALQEHEIEYLKAKIERLEKNLSVI